MKIEITDVQRLTVKPGDRLIIRTPGKIDAATAGRIVARARAALDLPDDVRIVVLDNGMSVEVAECP